ARRRGEPGALAERRGLIGLCARGREHDQQSPDGGDALSGAHDHRVGGRDGLETTAPGTGHGQPVANAWLRPSWLGRAPTAHWISSAAALGFRVAGWL